MTDIEANFIGIFKVGDNIQYNLRALSHIYELYNDRQKQPYLRKIIIIQIGSILDAVLSALVIGSPREDKKKAPPLRQGSRPEIGLTC